MSKKENKEVIKLLHENYNNINKKMVAELNLASDHGGISGNFREEMWMKFFRDIVPKKFSLAQEVKIIDSTGNISNEVDIAIFDEQYTPYVLQYGSLKFIPIEAVACVVECKSHSLEKDKLKKWADSIDNLKSNPTGIARVIQGLAIGLTNKTQQKTRPIKIQVSLYSTDKKSNKTEEDLKDYFDIIIRPKKIDVEKEKIEKFSLTIYNEEKTLRWWVKNLNGSELEEGKIIVEHLTKNKIEEYDFLYNEIEGKISLNNTLKELKIKNNEILSLTFQLNQLLMLINNPMMFPHFAYAKTFNEIIGGIEKK